MTMLSFCRPPSREPKHDRSVFRVYAIVFTCGALSTPTFAIDFASLVRRVGRVSDDVPVHRIDEVARDAASSRAGRELLEKSGARAVDAMERTKALRRALRETLGESDASLLRQIDDLNEPAQQAALILSRGARTLERGMPDIAMRSRFFRDSGAETVAALGRFDDLLDDAMRFDIALRGGRISSPPGVRSITLQDFGRFFHQQGGRGHHFWVKYVRPHWKLWLGGSALAAVLVAPDEYLDSVGDFTSEGLNKLGVAAGDILGKTLQGMIEGAGEGTKKAIRHANDAVTRTFLKSVSGVAALLVLVSVGLFLLPFTRRSATRRLSTLLASCRGRMRTKRHHDSVT